jgi:hypothetical protein
VKGEGKTLAIPSPLIDLQTDKHTILKKHGRLRGHCRKMARCSQLMKIRARAEDESERSQKGDYRITKEINAAAAVNAQSSRRRPNPRVSHPNSVVYNSHNSQQPGGDRRTRQKSGR